MSIIDRLLIRETAKTTLVIVSVLVLLILANTMVGLLGQTAAGLISPELMLGLLELSLVKLVAFVLPPAFFFAILWVMGNLYRDSEMAALFAAGVAQWRLYRPIFLLAVPVAILVSWLTLWVVPQLRLQSDVMRQDHSANIRLSGIKPRAFNEFNNGDLVVFVTSADDESGELHQVFVRHIHDGKPGVVVAERAHVDTDENTGARFVVLEDGYRYQGEEGVSEYSISSFSEYGVRMPDIQEVSRSNALVAKPSNELWKSSRKSERAELQYRLASPLSVFALILLSVPLARSSPRQGVYGRLIVAILIFALFMNLQKLAQDWMANGSTPEILGIWWLPLALALLALFIDQMDGLGFRVWWKRLGARV